MSILPYRLVSPLGRSRLGARWLGVGLETNSTSVVHLRASRDPSRVLRAVADLQSLHHPHVLAIERAGMDEHGSVWISTPYTGNHDGLLTLESLRSAKGGRLPASEVEQVVDHLLSATAFAHASGSVHGPLSAGEVLVDRRGSVLVELYAMGERLMPNRSLALSRDDLIRDEIRSIAALGYRLLTGVEPDEPRIPASRLVKRLDERWDRWFEFGLDPAGGFATAREATAARVGTEDPSPVRVVLGRVRSVLTRS